MSQYNVIAASPECTVVSEYTPEERRSEAFQSEAELERDLIRRLQSQGYEYLDIHTESDLIQNLRTQIERLNRTRFTDGEWERFFKTSLAGANKGIVEKTARFQTDHIQVLRRDDGSSMNVALIDKKQLMNNRLQVIHQYEVGQDQGARHDNRYDVTVLVNGLPVVHIELKRRGISLREAFNQINRYQRDSFWAGSGLFEYVQIFVISNGTHTKYYSNTTRNSHVLEINGHGSRKKTSNSFEFTSFWADGNNRPIMDLVDFTKTFFAKHALLHILTRYCVFTSEQQLLVMRPYQIAAVEHILSRIEVAHNYKKYGSADGGGYIWHTTGSGKTLTSFKAAQLATELPYIDKVLFVVDRKDLDHQTMEEYKRFEEGAANGNASTAILKKQLEDNSSRIIITTIQKLSLFVRGNPSHAVYGKQVVIIFDECHRSQFGDMHQAITKHFRNYYLFGFTGTPIFACNAGTGQRPDVRTTEQLFGDRLHTYTIVDAIRDGNVLPWRIDYVNTVKGKDGTKDRQVPGIDTESALLSPQRIQNNVSYILEHLPQKTMRSYYYDLGDRRVNGFNSILATSSIPACMRYYLELKRQIEEKNLGLTIATIYSYAANEEVSSSGLLPEDSFDTEGLDKSARDFLDDAIRDYNAWSHTNFDTSGRGFADYYKDLSMRVKNREVDILVVVNMFLTGFDATTLNTLWVDKNLKMHGLIQAFSRTNRILNSVKTFGNVVCFRDLEEETNQAIALFGDKDANSVVLLKSYDDYYYGCMENGRRQRGYEELVVELRTRFPLGQQIVGERDQHDFILIFGHILRLRNILTSFDQFIDIFKPVDLQDYTGMYHDIYADLRRQHTKADILNDVEYEVELVKQVEVNIDYILFLVQKYCNSGKQDKTIMVAIDKAIASSLRLRSKRVLIEEFIASINAEPDMVESWQAYIRKKYDEDLDALIRQHRLNEAAAKSLVSSSIRNGQLRDYGEDVDKILPPMSLFDTSRESKKAEVLEKLREFVERFLGLV